MTPWDDDTSRGLRAVDHVTSLGLAFYVVVAVLGLAVWAWDRQMPSTVPDVSSRIDALSGKD